MTGCLPETDPGASHLPLPTLLSQLLVAFTIELDNEFEHRMRPATSDGRAGSRQRPWHTSLVMWSTCMRFVTDEGVTVGELARLARTPTNLDGMRRWGYIVVEPDPTSGRRRSPRPDAVLRPTPAGRKAQEVWQPLLSDIEKRWRARFGAGEVDRLRLSLWGVASLLGPGLPDCLPILGHGLWSSRPKAGHDRSPAKEHLDCAAPPPPQRGTGAALSLATLLSRVLLAYATDYEQESHLSLGISANVLRVLGEHGMRVQDLPSVTGVSKESIAMATGFLQRGGWAVVEPDPAGSRWKVVSLTGKGRKAVEAYRGRLASVEEAWGERFGQDKLTDLRRSTEPFLAGVAERALLFEGLKPYPDGWRASVPPPGALPHFPMVLHRGGFPDGS